MMAHQGQPQGIAPTINHNKQPVGVPLVGTRDVDIQKQPNIHNTNNHNTQTIKNRQSIRLKKYDYSQNGLYFITIVTQGRKNLFGEIIDNKMVLNIAGAMIEEIHSNIVNDFQMIRLHEYIIMPNHIHTIIEIVGNHVGVPLVGTRDMDNQIQSNTLNTNNHQGQPQGIAPTYKNKTIGDVIGVFKSITTNRYIQMVKENIVPPFEKRIWQRNYWDHIIRNENDYNKITEYIVNNPLTWADDTLNSEEANAK
jgi:REP element-mobilizing transposase RayT